MAQKLVAFIPVRGGSKSIPLKNIKLMAGKPLVYWVIEAALATKAIEHIYISTDSNEIRDCVRAGPFPQKKLSVISRSPNTATDKASSELPLIEFCNHHNFEHVFFIQATSPLLSEKDLSNSWKKYENNNFDSLLSVVRQKRFIWEDGDTATPLNYCPQKRPRRQEFEGFFVENGAFYLSSREAILSSKCRLSGKIGLYEMSEKTYVEIDEHSDWNIIESFLIDKKNKVSNQNRNHFSTQKITTKEGL